MATNRSVGSFASSTKSAAGSDIEGSLEAGQKASILNEFRAGEFMSSPANDDMQWAGWQCPYLATSLSICLSTCQLAAVRLSATC